MRERNGSGLFSLYRASARSSKPALVPSIHLVEDRGPGPGVTQIVESDCCGQWKFAAKSGDAYQSDGVSLKLDFVGMYHPEYKKYV